MVRRHYDEQLQALHAALIEMGEMISGAIGRAVSALLARDAESAREVIAYDEEIDRQERVVETLCYKLLLSQQPVAGDLRRVSSALKIITDMERIGDHAADISELTLMLRELPSMSNEHLREMATRTTDMLLASLAAYVEQDMEKAEQVIAQDDAVDALFVAVKRDLVEAITADPKRGEAAADLLMAAKYLERIGDHATNIAEWAIFAHTGRHAGERASPGFNGDLT